ncbi:MAG: NAD(P)-dependent oxidoreductase [Spirochaeta sp.]
MTIMIIGASGRSGKAVTQELLKRGHKVRGLVRKKERYGTPEEGVTLIEGDSLDYASMKEAAAGADVIVSTMGPVRNSPAHLMQQSAEHTIAAAKAAGIQRVIWMSGAGVKDSRDEKSISRPIIRGIMKIVAGSVLKDSEAGYKVITGSDLDYTILRAPILKDGEAERDYQLSYTPPKAQPLTRGDIAVAIADLIQENAWVKESPMIGKK